MSSAALLAFALVSAASQQANPIGLPGIAGMLVAYWRRKEDLGGFLFLYLWQVYAGVIGGVLIVLLSFQSFVPESYQSSRDYHLYLGMVLPTLIVVAAQAVIATMLLAVRTPDMLNVLRGLVVVQALIVIPAAMINSKVDSEQANAFSGALLFPLIWAVYFFVSRRVRHVFETNDWYEKVEQYYPSETKIFT